MVSKPFKDCKVLMLTVHSLTSYGNSNVIQPNHIFFSTKKIFFFSVPRKTDTYVKKKKSFSQKKTKIEWVFLVNRRKIGPFWQIVKRRTLK